MTLYLSAKRSCCPQVNLTLGRGNTPENLQVIFTFAESFNKSEKEQCSPLSLGASSGKSCFRLQVKIPERGFQDYEIWFITNALSNNVEAWTYQHMTLCDGF